MLRPVKHSESHPAPDRMRSRIVQRADAYITDMTREYLGSLSEANSAGG
jgi:hypothetical protein